MPAVSSVAAAFARAGMPWDDAQIVVAHRRTLRRAVNVCRAHPKVAVLTSPGAGPAELALLLDGVHRTFVICEELGTDREQVTVLTSENAADHAWRDPNVVIVLGGGPATEGDGWLAGPAPGYPSAPRGWALPAREYGGDLGAGEAAELRAAQLARLGPRVGDLVWDIGCGSGALAAEAARFGAAVIAVDDERGGLRAHRIDRPPLRRSAPGRPRAGPRTSWSRCPSPTSYGSGAGARPWWRRAPTAGPERIVTHAATRDEAEAVGAALAAGGYDVECALLQSVDLDTRAWSERERSVVFLLSGRRKERSP